MLEHLGVHYLQKGAVLFDLFGSRDGEALAWLRSPYVKDKRVLLLKGENVDVDASHEVKPVESLSMSDIERYDFIISASPLYTNPDEEFFNAAKVTDLLYKRIHWKRLVYLVVREAANFYYSRLKISESQVFAKANMIYLIREGRHCGITLALDSVRYYAIDIDIRNLADYTIFKAQGVQGLSRDMEWLYSYFNPAVVRSMKAEQFIIVSRTGALGLGTFPFHEWHKREKENILKSVGIRVEYGEALERGIDRGIYKTVGDKEHSQIISLYTEQNLGMNHIATNMGRSTKTISDHIHNHNNAVERSGFCPNCRRVKSPFEAQIARRS